MPRRGIESGSGSLCRAHRGVLLMILHATQSLFHECTSIGEGCTLRTRPGSSVLCTSRHVPVAHVLRCRVIPPRQLRMWSFCVDILLGHQLYSGARKVGRRTMYGRRTGHPRIATSKQPKRSVLTSTASELPGCSTIFPVSRSILSPTAVILCVRLHTHALQLRTDCCILQGFGSEALAHVRVV